MLLGEEIMPTLRELSPFPEILFPDDVNRNDRVIRGTETEAEWRAAVAVVPMHANYSSSHLARPPARSKQTPNLVLSSLH